MRKEFRTLKAYGAPQVEGAVRLNVNENPYPPRPALLQDLTTAIVTAAAALNRYPDPDAIDLRSDLAAYVHGRTGVALTGAHVWAANGSNEILLQIMQTFGGPGRCAVGFEPSYSMHPIIAAGTHTEWRPAPRRHDFTLDVERACAILRECTPNVTFLTSPNNPTGQSLGLADLARLLEAAPGMVVVDEAYAEFSTRPSAIELLSTFPDKLIISRTMSKAFAFAGGRLGYLVAAPTIVDALRQVRLPYHLSVLTQAAARVALRHAEDTLASLVLLSAERERVAAGLGPMGYEVVPSDANFLLFGSFSEAGRAWEAFVDHGVLIRDVGLPRHLRVSIGTPGENDAFLTAASAVAPTRHAL